MKTGPDWYAVYMVAEQSGGESYQSNRPPQIDNAYAQLAKQKHGDCNGQLPLRDQT